MEKKDFRLKRVVVKRIDEYSGELYNSRDAEIIVEQGNYDTYETNDSSIFDYYEELIMDKEEVKIEIETLVAFGEEDLQTLKRLFGIETTNKYKNSVYQRVQQYGGAEEGGWYYHNLYLSDMDYDSMTEKEREEIIDTDRYGNGYVHYEEFYRGENEKKEKEYYC